MSYLSQRDSAKGNARLVVGSEKPRTTAFLQLLFVASGVSRGEVRTLRSQEAVVWTAVCVCVCACALSFIGG